MNEEAIKELKEELKEIITWLAITINKEEMYERKERRKRAIEAALIALEQQPKTGHWIAMSEGFTPYKCSECEAVEFKKSKYCPRCGAEMEGEE